MKSIVRKTAIFGVIILLFFTSSFLNLNLVKAENQKEIHNEILSAFSLNEQKIRPGAVIRSDEKSYLIMAMGQTDQERLDGVFFPPYTLEIWIDGQSVVIDKFIYHDKENKIGSEPATWWIFYHIFEAYTFETNTWHSLKYRYCYYDLHPRRLQEAIVENVGFSVDQETPQPLPQFIETDYTELNKISRISRFRSGIGHDYSDSFESCRSMKHYYEPYEEYRTNYEIKTFSPVNGIVHSIENEQHGSSEGLTNKQIRIRSELHSDIIIVLFHVDLISSDISVGTYVNAGELLGHARVYYPDVPDSGSTFDIAVWQEISLGVRYISYFDIVSEDLFQSYIDRGVLFRSDLIITKEERDDYPLVCDENGIFSNQGPIINWVDLSQP